MNPFSLMESEIPANPFSLPRNDPELYHQREYERAEELEFRKNLQLIPIEDRHRAIQPVSILTQLREPKQLAITAPQNSRTAVPIKKESIRELIQRKREILLVKMSIQNKREMAHNLEEWIESEEAILREKFRDIEENEGRFEKYEEEMKLMMDNAIAETEKKLLERIEKQELISKLTEDIDVKIAQSERKNEELRQLEEYKKFIDEITPPEFIQKTERPVGNTFITEQMPLKIFFKSPWHFLERINSLEEKNLFLIEHAQEAEQELETLKHQQEGIRREILDSSNEISSNLSNYKKQKQALEIKLTEKAMDIEADVILDEKTIQTINEKVMRLYEYLGGDTSNNPSDLDMLEAIEAELERYLEKRASMEINLLKDREKKVDKKRRNQKVLEEQEKQAKKIQEDNERMRLRRERVIKREGRVQMAKTRPPEKERKKTPPKIPQEELDRRMFLED